MAKRNSEWRKFYKTLTAKQKNTMLLAILEWSIEDIGVDGEFQYIDREEDGGDFIWNSSGDSLIGKD